MVDAVVGVLLDRLIRILGNETQYVLEFPEQFQKLKNEIVFMQSYLRDANKVKIKDRKEVLKAVTRELRELLYDAEDIIDDYKERMFLTQERRRRRKFNLSFAVGDYSPSYMMFRYKKGKKLGEINKKIGYLKENMKSYLATIPSPLLSQEPNNVGGVDQPTEYPILITDVTDLVGIDDASEEIKKWVLQTNGGPLNVIGIVGMGGIGKTTLAQKVCDDDSMRERFDLNLFVTVSQSFKYEEILRNIMRQLKKEETSLMHDTRGLLQQLRMKLNGKKFLLILDDVWETQTPGISWWESLSSALIHGIEEVDDACSCVIITTRNVEVAQSMGVSSELIYRPDTLSEEDSYSLFAKIAFSRNEGRGRRLFPSLEAIGKEITSQCGGLPLAIKVVAGMMSRKQHSVQEWKRICEHLKRELAESKEDDKMFSRLKLSYEELPEHLKPCILCFSFFPEDFQIDDRKIICWWIGEGFVRGRDGKTAYEVGEEVFDELIRRCLLLGWLKDPFRGRFISCKVHDMVRDMFIKIAGEENFMAHQRQCLMTDTNMIGLNEETNSKLTRTLIVEKMQESEEVFVLNVRLKLWQLKRLRVLQISFQENGIELPKDDEDWLLSGIGSLSHLISLSIEDSKVKTLPNSIGNLHNLQVLNLESCRNLKRLPSEVTFLVNLTVLTIPHTVEYLPKGMVSLSNLEMLLPFYPASSRVGEDGCRISDLNKLTKLTILGIRVRSDDHLEEGEMRVLSELKQLKRLILIFESSSEELAMKINCEMLSPLQQLQELTIVSLPGQTTPAWLNPASLPNVQCLFIWMAEFRHMNPSFFGKKEENKVWNLDVFIMREVDQLEEDDKERIKREIEPSTRHFEI